MPRRRRTQRIEEESRRAFGDALEERFLLRDDVPDYGLDGSVEEFDLDDKATGLRYFVQLKATDEEELGDALSRSIPLEHADLYNSLPLPLLMVRYVAARDELYVRWWHDPLSPSKKGRADAASMTFRWSKGDLFETADSTRVAEEARGFLELRATDPPLPFFLELALEEPPPQLSGADVELSVKDAADARRDVVEVKQGATGGHIVVAPDRLGIQLAGVPIASMAIDKPYLAEEGDQLGIDAMALLAIGFARWGQHEIAARLTQTFFARSRLRGDPESALLLAGSMTSARRISESLGVASELDQRAAGEEDNTSVIFTLTPRRHGATLSQSEKEEYTTVIGERIARREAAGEAIAASREALSLGNHYRNEHQGEAALDLYRRAADLDPEYLERQHYWHEIAGVLFFSGRFEESAEAYEKAVELGGDAWSSILEADAVMFAGRYEEARHLFAQALPEIDSFERGAEYRLKISLLDDLIGEHGLGTQERDRARSAGQIQDTFGGDAVPEHDAAVAACRAAFQADGLNPFAWWNLAAAAETEENFAEAGTLFIWAALCLPQDPEPWAFAVLHLLHAEDFDLIPAALMTGQRLTADRVLPKINQLIASKAKPEVRSTMIYALGRIVEGLREPRKDAVLIRFVQTGAATTESELPGARTRPEPEV